MGKNRGFTLIELIVAIAVMAIIVTLAAPSFTQIVRKNQLSSDARSFADLLTEQRSEAIFKQSDRQVTLDTTAPASPPCDGIPICATSAAIKTLYLNYTHISKESGDVSVTFNRLGQSGIAAPANGQCFVLKHKSDSSLKFYIYVQKAGTILSGTTATSCPT